MESSGAKGRFRDVPWDDMGGAGPAIRAVLENTEAALRTSARRLRGCGEMDRARRVERFATWTRFDLDEPLVAQQLYAAAARLRSVREVGALAEQALEKVLSLARADRGNVQLADPSSGALRIIAQQGFDEEFLHHFAVVDDERSACGRAAKHGAQLVINDVIVDRAFRPHREIAAASGFRAVQSTPLIDRAGRLIGVVSTHYPRPYAPPPRDMLIIQRYADLLGQVLASHPGVAVPDVPPAINGIGGTRTAESASPER